MSILNTANYTLGGTLPASAVTIGIWEEVPGKGIYPDRDPNRLAGLAAQQIQAEVRKDVRPVYEIGSTNYYVVDGRPQGTGRISYLFGPSGEVVSQLESFANQCHTCALMVEHNGAAVCKADGTITSKGYEGMIFSGGTLTSFSIQATAENFMVVGDIGFIFMDVRRPGSVRK